MGRGDQRRGGGLRKGWGRGGEGMNESRHGVGQGRGVEGRTGQRG